MNGDGHGTKMRPLSGDDPDRRGVAHRQGRSPAAQRTVRVGLAEAHGRVLAEGIVAARDVPPFDRAAMDGYAVVAADTAGASRDEPVRLRCVGTVHTGEVAARAVGAGECLQIATGAPLPGGADAVVMVEQTGRRGDEVDVRAPVRPRQHVGRRGADIAAGQTALRAGDVLTPSRRSAREHGHGDRLWSTSARRLRRWKAVYRAMLIQTGAIVGAVVAIMRLIGE